MDGMSRRRGRMQSCDSRWINKDVRADRPGEARLGVAGNGWVDGNRDVAFFLDGEKCY